MSDSPAHLARWYEDSDVLAKSAVIDKGHAEGLFDTARCAVFGALCSEVHIVSVPVQPGAKLAEHRPRNVDLVSDIYVDPEALASFEVISLNDVGSCVRKYPHGTPRPQPFGWTIFAPTWKGSRKSPLPRNKLYDSLKTEFGCRTVYGNVLIVKTDPCGYVCDVLERELFFLERLLYSFMEDEDKHEEFPVLINPILMPRQKDSWDSW